MDNQHVIMVDGKRYMTVDSIYERLEKALKAEMEDSKALENTEEVKGIEIALHRIGVTLLGED